MEGNTEQQSEAAERLTVTGAVEAVSQKENRYGIRVGEEWYGGFGACPVSKGQVCVVDYLVRGQYRNIVRVRDVGEGVGASLPAPRFEQPAAQRNDMPAAVMNYQTDAGWKQAEITGDEEKAIQEAVRWRNNEIMDDCLEDAKTLLQETVMPRISTPKNVLELAMFLAERRIVHVSRVFDEFLRAKVAAERGAVRRASEGDSPSAPGAEADAV